MYSKVNSIPIKGSATLAQNNLSILSNQKDRHSVYCVVGKNSVYLTLFEDEKHVNLKQIVPKVNKEIATEGQILTNILEAKFLNVADRILLVILATKGIFFYNEDGANLLYHHNLDMKASLPEETSCARGVATLSPNLVAVGTSSGIILIFEIAPKGSVITLKNEINDKHFQSGIAALTSDFEGNFLCAADTVGNIVVFSVKTLSNIKAYQIFDSHKASVTALCMWENYLISALGSGIISIFDISEGTRVVDINAHGRWIYSLDVKRDLLVSSGEDCYFRVWQLNEVNKKLKVSHLHSEKIVDTLITSAQFNHGTEEICVSSFDNMELLVYKEQ